MRIHTIIAALVFVSFASSVYAGTDTIYFPTYKTDPPKQAAKTSQSPPAIEDKNWLVKAIAAKHVLVDPEYVGLDKLSIDCFMRDGRPVCAPSGGRTQ